MHTLHRTLMLSKLEAHRALCCLQPCCPESLAAEDERTGLNQEQLGAIDFLILAKAQVCAGSLADCQANIVPDHSETSLTNTQ
jgi:hypothetical protein